MSTSPTERRTTSAAAASACRTDAPGAGAAPVLPRPAPRTPGRATGGSARPRHWLRAGWMMTASGWSANQFSALLGAYRGDLGLTTATTTALFAVYVLGLIPGLLLGGPLADRRGRRPVVYTALATAAVATCLLMAGPAAAWLLWPGRFLTGLGAGALLTAGSVWIKELSSAPHDPSTAPGTAARRSGLFLSAGFASGGLAAALIAQWAPYPMITAYVPHLVLSAVAAAAAGRAPETVRTGSAHRPAAHEARPTTHDHVPRGGSGASFRRLIAPVAPWVFAAPTIAFVTLPGLVGARLDGWQTVYAGVATAVTPGAGLLVAPLARRLAARHRLATAVTGLAAVALGLLVGALAVMAVQPALALAAAVVLGAGYGLCVAYGLTEVAALAPPHRLARLTARFWTLAYLGFFAPYGVTLLSALWSPQAILAAAALLAVLTLGAVARAARRERL
ncbi:MFS transporter [Streptomyces sp. WAC 06725]|uniref:MFS transporter n=1 Tax=Streptomyces sp. WAC 06725 TaxID=2203209 RepID=UPI0021AE17C5|nr:MFS transporter [Streptomyces sp. WAC 06725]